MRFLKTVTNNGNRIQANFVFVCLEIISISDEYDNRRNYPQSDFQTLIG